MDQLPPVHALAQDCTWNLCRTQNLGMCPDPEGNLQPFGVEDPLQPTESPQQGLSLILKTQSSLGKDTSYLGSYFNIFFLCMTSMQSSNLRHLLSLFSTSF